MRRQCHLELVQNSGTLSSDRLFQHFARIVAVLRQLHGTFDIDHLVLVGSSARIKVLNEQETKGWILIKARGLVGERACATFLYEIQSSRVALGLFVRAAILDDLVRGSDTLMEVEFQYAEKVTCGMQRHRT